MWQLDALMLRSENAISPWPVAPCWPRNDSESRLAVHSAIPVLGVAGVVVVRVAVLVAGVVAVAVLGGAPELFALRLLEPPQAVSAIAASTIVKTAVVRM